MTENRPSKVPIKEIDPRLVQEPIFGLLVTKEMAQLMWDFQEMIAKEYSTNNENDTRTS